MYPVLKVVDGTTFLAFGRGGRGGRFTKGPPVDVANEEGKNIVESREPDEGLLEEEEEIEEEEEEEEEEDGPDKLF